MVMLEAKLPDLHAGEVASNRLSCDNLTKSGRRLRSTALTAVDATPGTSGLRQSERLAELP